MPKRCCHLKGYNAIYKHDFVCISDTFLDSSITEGDKNTQLNYYNLIRGDHPSNTKWGGVYLLQTNIGCSYF